ncbi:MAG: tRNA (adenosine(37)-N6)-threonylcarbamoyltransferase complex dimerization subunit type 1 TsaB [Oscillospiraceae bacterium]
MIILALETSAKAASCAVGENGKLISQYYQDCGLTHSRTLMPMVESMLKNSEVKKEDIGCAAVAVGPGSFTGLRIGVAAAKGFAWALDLPCCAVSTLEALAEQAAFAGKTICAVMDARRKQFYTAIFEPTDDGLRRLLPDCAISADELREKLKKIKKPILLVGDGTDLCYNILQDSGIDLSPAPAHLKMQSAAGVLRVAERKLKRGETVTADALLPNYLRLSQAERERLAGSDIK